MDKLRIGIGIIFILLFVGVVGYDLYRSVIYDIDVGGHLKLAAKANTPSIALSEMNIAIKAMEDKGYTTGFTSILYRTPDEDVGFWYNNMKATRDSLMKLDENTSQLEESNVLMKLRESIVDDTGESESLKDPVGITNFPYNAPLAYLEAFLFLLTLFGAYLIVTADRW